MTEELVDWRHAAYAKSRRLVKNEVGELRSRAKYRTQRPLDPVSPRQGEIA